MNRNLVVCGTILSDPGKRKTLEEIVAGIFLNVMKAINPQTKKVEQTPGGWGGSRELIEKS